MSSFAPIELSVPQGNFINKKARVGVELEMIDIDDEIGVELAELSFENAKSTLFDIGSNRDLNSIKTEISKLLLVLKNLNKYREANNKTEIIGLLNYLTKLEHNATFSYLLEMSHEELANLLKDINVTRFTNKSYEFVLNLLSMSIIRSRLDASDYIEPEPQRSLLYGLQLKTLITFLEQHSSDEDIAEHPLFDTFKRLNRAYIEFNQNAELKRLEMGIDLARFETDQQYKHETILGLSEDMATFNLAVSLAKFYEFDLWMVYASFTKFLLIDEQNEHMSLDKIEELVRPLLSVLKQRSDEYEAVMFKKVFKYIEGTNLEKLSLFYKLLDNDESELHMKIIKKLKSINLPSEEAKLNYKELLESPYETVEPYLDDDTNLQIFTKLLPKLPVTNKNTELKPSKLYAVWCLKRFWSNLDELSEAELENEASLKTLINESFESLVENLKKLDVNTDFVFFVKELTLNRKCCEKLSVSVRRELLKRMNRLAKQMEKTSQTLESNSGLNKIMVSIQGHLKLVESVQKLFANQAKASAEKNKRHIQSIDKELGKSFIASEDQDCNEELKAEKLEHVLTYLLFDGYTIDFINELVTQLGLNQTTCVKNLIKLCLGKVSQVLIEEKKKPESKSSCMTRLNTLLDTIASYLNSAKKDNKLLNDEDVMQCMRAFCNDQQVDISIRLFILEELKRIIKTMSESDLMLLLVYKTNAILLNCGYFGGKLDGAIESEVIENEQKRTEYLQSLIDLSDTKTEYLALLNLVKVWPKFSKSASPSENMLNTILIKLVTNEPQFVDVLDEFKENNVNMEVVRVDDLSYIKDEIEASSFASNFVAKIAFLKLCLAFKAKENENFIKKFMRTDEEFQRLEVVESNDDDVELMSQLERDQFYLEIINTNFFTYFTGYLIRNEEDRSKLHKVARVLKTSGFELEAARFVCEIEDFYSAYQSLSCSLALLDKAL